MDFLLGGSFRIGRFAGIDVRVHILFVLFALFQLFSAGAEWEYQLTFIAFLFVSVLLHEFGHCFGARSVGGYADHILMWPLGGLAFVDAPRTPWAQFVTVACGPLVNLVLAAACVALLLISGEGAAGFAWSWIPVWVVSYPGGWAEYVTWFYYVNAMLFMFNVLLPIFPFDGGRILQIILWLFMGERSSLILACKLGIGGAIVLLGIGLGLTGDPNTMFVMIAIFGGIQSFQTLMAAQAGVAWDERITRYSPRPVRRGPGWWARLKGKMQRGPREEAPPAARGPVNPNPGGWQAKLDEESRLDAEVDRILKKVHDSGLGSLSYVEKQTLERARRKRLENEREIESGGRT